MLATMYTCLVAVSPMAVLFLVIVLVVNILTMALAAL